MGKIFFCLLLFSVSAHSQTFQDFVNRVNAAPVAQRSAIVDSFMNAVPVFPYREQDTLCHFLYRGNVNSVEVPGDANGWNPAAFASARLTTTNLWYLTKVFPGDTRLDYKLVLNGSNWILDPRNPYQVSGGFGPNSELRMPAFAPPPEIEFYPGIPHGTLRDTTFFSNHLGNARTLRVYLPPLYDSTNERYPVVLFHDGLEYLSLAKADNVLNYLIAQKRLVPVIAVFVPPVRRREEYATSLQDQFTAFIVEEVMDWIDRRYRTRTDPAARAVLGSSDGGNISLWIGARHPEVFGNVAALSSNVEPNVAAGYSNSPLLALKLYLDMGTYDIPVLLPRMQVFLPSLSAKGYDFVFREIHDGHSWGNWRGHIDEALQLFFPGPALRVHDRAPAPPAQHELSSYPNPFRRETAIRFALGRKSHIQLSIFNIQGQLVRELVAGEYPAGEHTWIWRGENAHGVLQANGVYFYRMQINGQVVAAQRVVLLR
ncbi:MAG: alpha/beta hydrolase-fold protein [bacterium]